VQLSHSELVPKISILAKLTFIRWQ